MPPWAPYGRARSCSVTEELQLGVGGPPHHLERAANMEPLRRLVPLLPVQSPPPEVIQRIMGILVGKMP